MNSPRITPSCSGGLSIQQRMLRRRASRLPFKTAVWLATDAMFCFTHREDRTKALWSERVRAWLGSKTFLHWALVDADMDIPRIVAGTPDAPENTQELQKAVREVLLAYWAEHLVSLPSKSTPRWLPLP